MRHNGETGSWHCFSLCCCSCCSVAFIVHYLTHDTRCFPTSKEMASLSSTSLIISLWSSSSSSSPSLSCYCDSSDRGVTIVPPSLALRRGPLTLLHCNALWRCCDAVMHFYTAMHCDIVVTLLYIILFVLLLYMLWHISDAGVTLACLYTMYTALWKYSWWTHALF